MAVGAWPASVAGKAAVYALDTGGYVKVRDSQNGFTGDRPTFSADQPGTAVHGCGRHSHIPSTHSKGSRKLRAEGKSPEEIKRFAADVFAKGVFQAQTRPGVDYMLSTENLVPVDDKGTIGHFPPHLMFYGPYLTNADLGSDGSPRSPAFVAGEGTPHALIIVRSAPRGSSLG